MKNQQPSLQAKTNTCFSPLIILNDQGGSVMQVMNDDVSPTLREQMKHHEPIVCYSVGADLTWQGCSGLTQTATTLDTAARTLSKSQPKTCAVVCYAEKRFFEWHEDDKSVNIRASSGSYGGGSEVLVCTRRQSEHCAEQTTSGFSNNK